MTVLVTLSVPDAADAAALIAVAADSTALTVIHTTGVEGHLPLPGSTVLRGRQPRPWLAQSVTAATLNDLAGGVIDVAFTALYPDEVDSPTNPTPHHHHHHHRQEARRLRRRTPRRTHLTREPAT